MMRFRTMLNVPANSPKMLLNTNLMGADVVLLDLEDGVALNQKTAARELLCAYLRKGYARTDIMVRVNDVNTPFFQKDIEAVIPLPILGIMLPKMEKPEEIQYADREISRIETVHGLPLGSRIIVGTAESALGVENAYSCLSCCERAVGCSFGSEDFAVSMGVRRSASNEELEYARRHLVVAARAAGKFEIDTVYTNVNDDEGLRAMTEQGKRLGYVGKFVISPKQVSIVHSVYTPTDEELAYAMAAKEKMREAEARGSGVAMLNGKMLDRPVIQQVERILDMARAAGLLKEEHQI